MDTTTKMERSPELRSSVDDIELTDHEDSFTLEDLDTEKSALMGTTDANPKFTANGGQASMPWLTEGPQYHDHPPDADVEGLHDDEHIDLAPLPHKKKSSWRRSWNPTRYLWMLLPSFVARRYGHSEVEAAKANETSYLNGLRGIAALIVVLQHTTEEYYIEIHSCYGDGLPGMQHYIQLPILRLVLLGSFSVALFFVISGFALTYGPLKRIHAGNSDAALAAMPSSIFRRPIRLFLPILPVYVISWILIQGQFMYGLHTDLPLAKWPNILWEAWAGLKHFSFIDTSPYIVLYYFRQGWTLHDEHMGSLLVFLCCIAFARTTTGVRMMGVAAVAVYQFYTGGWVGFLFLGGMLLADLRHVRAKMATPKPVYRWLRALGATLLLAPSLFFGSWPYVGTMRNCVGFKHFAGIGLDVMAQHHFFHALSAVSLIFAMESLPALQWLLNTAPVLYLGDISYSLYLMHWAVAYSWSKALSLAMMRAGFTKLTACLSAVTVTVVTGIWVADLFWRFSDAQSVRFSKWLSRRIKI